MISRKAKFRASRKLEKITGYRIPDTVFSGVFLEIISSSLNFEHLERSLRNQILNFIRDFATCDCRESPLCGCPERKFAMHIIELREMGLDHRQISDHLLEEYGINLFPADILSFLEDSVHVLEAILDVADLQGSAEMAEKTRMHVRNIER